MKVQSSDMSINLKTGERRPFDRPLNSEELNCVEALAVYMQNSVIPKVVESMRRRAELALQERIPLYV